MKYLVPVLLLLFACSKDNEKCYECFIIENTNLSTICTNPNIYADNKIEIQTLCNETERALYESQTSSFIEGDTICGSDQIAFTISRQAFCEEK